MGHASLLLSMTTASSLVAGNQVRGHLAAKASGENSPPQSVTAFIWQMLSDGGHVFQGRNLVGNRWKAYHAQEWGYYQGFRIHSTLPHFLSDGMVHTGPQNIA